jgi:hypothetical protein
LRTTGGSRDGAAFFVSAARLTPPPPSGRARAENAEANVGPQGGADVGDGDLGRIRTSDPRVRSAMLYPAELRGQHSTGRLARLSRTGEIFGVGGPWVGRISGRFNRKPRQAVRCPPGSPWTQPTLVRPCPSLQRMSWAAGSAYQRRVSMALVPAPARVSSCALCAATFVPKARLEEARLAWKNSAAQSTATTPQTAQCAAFC